MSDIVAGAGEEAEGGGGGQGVEEVDSGECNGEKQLGCVGAAAMNRKEKRKAAKKMKRKQMRKEAAAREREEEEAMMNDPEELRRLEEEEREEAERKERERKEFEERERAWVEAMERKKKEKEEEDERRRAALEESRELQEIKNGSQQSDEDGDWENVEEGPAEIIWQGNEITVKKKRVKVPKKGIDLQKLKEDADRPTSNPLPPESEAFFYSRNSLPASAQQILENVSQQVPNFGTEQDKAHCPFHLKTGACRFGQRCSRVHFYPVQSCTLLMRNMYNGPGLAWEQDEGLEHTDEEIERCYEEFYEDVHTEFLKFGEIVNFKVCKNGSFHLRGNVYVHYKSVDSAVLAYNSISGRYFAGKQVNCEYVNVVKWKVAICGEYMRSRYKSCSHGTACNFIHCFCNPGGDYMWADWDKPSPRYWIKKMIALFGYSEEHDTVGKSTPESVGLLKNSSPAVNFNSKRNQSHRSRSMGTESDHHLINRGGEDGVQTSRSPEEYNIEDWKPRKRSYSGSNGRDKSRLRYSGLSSKGDYDSNRDMERHHHARESSREHRIILERRGDHKDSGRRARTPVSDRDPSDSDADREEEPIGDHQRSPKRHKKRRRDSGSRRRRSGNTDRPFDNSDDDDSYHGSQRRRSRSSWSNTTGFQDRWDPGEE
ncbi:hypothetical protein SAY87_014157 [Trapa incisa]|uniref:Zinc finger CCCH domain-containing protein 5 n=1 Tax=Trapa incisa TaxID=236973 RepID=A0AAN7GNA6_9MYRT|nr:hypothetical protein SAY87_014157 [Trapa incisa]